MTSVLVPRILLCLLAANGSFSSDMDATRTLTQLAAVEGDTVDLPCDLHSAVPADIVRVVTWFHNSGGKSFYTYDSRNYSEGARVGGQHWLRADFNDGRITYLPKYNPSLLRISNLTRSDQSVYRCRVDFKESPTRNSRINLTVIVSPRTPLIYDAKGQSVEGRTSLLRVGHNTSFLCRTSGGEPQSNLTWWRKNSLVDSSWDRDPNGDWVKNKLTLGPLSRADLGTEYTCQASNHPLSTPKSTKIIIDLLLRPISVSFVSPPAVYIAGDLVNVTCRTAGSRPAAGVAWWLGSRQLTDTYERAVDNNNVTISTLSWRPEMSDAGGILRCIAENVHLRRDALEASIAPNIHYRPVVVATLVKATSGDAEANIEPDGVVTEGDDVHLHCDIKATPPAQQTEWLREGKPIETDRAVRKILIEGDSLVVQAIERGATGKYSCRATNSLGVTESQSLTVRVKAVPLCNTTMVETLYAARGETVNLTCAVISFPTAIKFSWSLNSSAGVLPVSGSPSTESGNTSWLSYTPVSTTDYGQLTCRAINSVGSQVQPCRYNVVMTERPSPPKQCRWNNISATSLELVCDAGHSGGLYQKFTTVATLSSTNHTVLTRTSTTPRLVLNGLLPDCNYTVTIYAFNAKGRSDSVAITAATLQRDTVEPLRFLKSVFYVTPLHGVMIGIMGTFLLLILVVCIAVRVRTHRSRRDQRMSAAFSHVAVEPHPAAVTTVDRKQKCKFDSLADPVERDMAERLNRSGDFMSLSNRSNSFTPNIIHHYRPDEDHHHHQQHAAYFLSPHSLPVPGGTTRLSDHLSGSSDASDGQTVDAGFSETTSSAGETAPLMEGRTSRRESSV